VLADEIFGPLLAIERVADVEAACDIVDGLDYALTGGLFSANPRTSITSRRARRSETST
jgi:RHH-type proline utilization regulon transcriptional repressor/proline dehydrogenase/delta 1-pyrroline-5-carboxylate dehydrogenase